MKGKRGAACPFSRPVIQLDIDGVIVAVWPSTRDAHRTGKYDCGGISKCCHGKIETHMGYKWSYQINQQA
jgi:hypothetical protein